MLNSGEGGFLCTDSEEYAARAACYAGCYEKLYEQHVVAPPAVVFDAVKLETPNYSLRMNELAAACIRPQIDNLEDRVAAYNKRYARVVERLAGCKYMSIPPYNERVRPVADSLQFNLLGFDDEGVQAFLANSKRRGLPVGLFGSKDNSRNHRTWQYAPTTVELPVTDARISAAIDVRLPLMFGEEDLDQMCEVLLAAMADTTGDPEGASGRCDCFGAERAAAAQIIGYVGICDGRL